MAWIIGLVGDEELAWSNTDGWVDETFTTFTDDERAELSLPIGGEWIRVPWQREDRE